MNKTLRMSLVALVATGLTVPFVASVRAQEKTKIDMTPAAPPDAVPAVAAPSMAAPAKERSSQLLLSHDDGKMNDRLALNASGATVEFNAPEAREVGAVQFYGARYGATVKPSDSFSVIISDSAFKPIIRIEKPLMNLSPSRETWQTVAITPAAKVDGKFYVTLVYNSNLEKGIYIGVDSDSPSGYSKVGLPGTVASDVDAAMDWMIRASTQKPGQYDAARAAAAASSKKAADAMKARSATVTVKPATAPKATASSPSGTVRPGTGAATVAKSRPSSSSGKTRMAVPRPAAGSGQVAYRDPYRRLSFGSKAPALKRGCGRVDVSWNTMPVTVELSYVGKPPKTIENLDVKRLVVDFPVPEPGLFNVVLRKPGYQPESRQFRVVSGSRQEWHVTLQPGADTGTAAPPVSVRNGAGVAPVLPSIEDSSTPLPEAVPVAPPAPGFNGRNGENRNPPSNPGPNGVGAPPPPGGPPVGMENGRPGTPPPGAERPRRRPTRAPNASGAPAPPPAPEEAPAPPPPAPGE